MKFPAIAVLVFLLTLISSFTNADHVIDDSKSKSYLFVLSGTSG